MKFVGDIAYIHTWQGFVYLATVIDCYSKKVVGWSIAAINRHIISPTNGQTIRDGPTWSPPMPDAARKAQRAR
ncbi:transposase InsO family protein [Arthrobacter sp. MP_2.3]